MQKPINQDCPKAEFSVKLSTNRKFKHEKSKISETKIINLNNMNLIHGIRSVVF